MARQFNGSTDKIDADSAVLNMSGQQAFSFAFWAKATIAQSNVLNPFGNANSGAAGPFFQAQGDASGKLVYAARSLTSGSSDTTTSTAVYFDNTWHHCVVTQPSGSSTLSIYIDGVLDHTFARTSLSNNTTQTFNTLSFGYLHRNTSAQFFAGALADVAAWTRTITAQEVALLGSGAEASLLAPNHYWPLWGVDSPEPDIGNG